MSERSPDFDNAASSRLAAEHMQRQWARFMRGARAEQILSRYGWLLFLAGAVRSGFDLWADAVNGLGWPWLAFDVVSAVGLLALTAVGLMARRHSIMRDQLNAARLLDRDG